MLQTEGFSSHRTPDYFRTTFQDRQVRCGSS